MNELRSKHCKSGLGSADRLDEQEIGACLPLLHSDWQRVDGNTALEREFEFRDFYQTMAFVNGLALIAHEEDHHPDLWISYRRCRVRLTTHSAGGLTENDFICAAKIDALPSAGS